LIRGRNDGTLIPQREGFNTASLLRRRGRNPTNSSNQSYHVPYLCVAEPKVDPKPFQMRGYAMVMCAFCVGIVAVSTILAPLAGPRTCSIKPIALPSSGFLPHTFLHIVFYLTARIRF